MILLIIGVGMLNFLLPAHLNSIMFLLIHISKQSIRLGYTTLNSIMFLLIQFFAFAIFLVVRSFKFHYVSINSN